jgi:hypothetical protein
MRNEIESLNFDGMAVEELERRIELGQMIPILTGLEIDAGCICFDGNACGCPNLLQPD